MSSNYPPGVSDSHPYFHDPESECPEECQECGAELDPTPEYGESVSCPKCGEDTHWATDEELREWAEEDAADRAYEMERERGMG